MSLATALPSRSVAVTYWSSNAEGTRILARASSVFQGKGCVRPLLLRCSTAGIHARVVCRGIGAGIRCPAESDGAWRSLVAHLLWEQRVAGSNPAAPTKTSLNVAPVAQGIEHRPSKPGVAGSNPAGRAMTRTIE